MTDAIRVLLVDDHPLFREGVANTLSADPGFEVVGEGACADDALRLANDLLPDIALLDVSMPGGGIAAACAISSSCPVVRIVMLTVSEEEEDVLAALKGGARGYVLKGITASELTRVLRTIHEGEAYVTPTLAASLLTDFRKPPPAAVPASRNPIDDLTERESQILEQVATGRSNKEIARRLNLSEKTVKHYMTNVLQKLQVRNRVEAALLAQKPASAD